MVLQSTMLTFHPRMGLWQWSLEPRALALPRCATSTRIGLEVRRSRPITMERWCLEAQLTRLVRGLIDQIRACPTVVSRRGATPLLARRTTAIQDWLIWADAS